MTYNSSGAFVIMQNQDKFAHLKSKLIQILREGKTRLHEAVRERTLELEAESPDYYKFLEILGFSIEESTTIDKYHNIGRIVFRHLGDILEKLALTVLTDTVGGVRKVKLPNKQGGTPKSFWIDWVYNKRAYEVKWRYATTDGTTVNKEIAFVRQLYEDGYLPVFVTFYKPLREQPLACFNRICEAYRDHNGEVYSEQTAWSHIESISGFNLREFIFSIEDPL